MQDICFQWRDTGTCRFGANCKFDHGGLAVAGPSLPPGMEASSGTGDGGERGSRKRHRGNRKRSRSRDRGRDRRYQRRRRSRSRDRDRRRRGRGSPSPDPFGRDVRRRSSSIEREETQREEMRRQQQEKKIEEAKFRKEQERIKKRKLKQLTSTAKWNGEGPRPPGTDLSQYRHDKDMGYVAKNKCWVFTPGEPNLWYQKRTGRYYVYDEATHEFVYSHGGVDPTQAQKPAEAQAASGAAGGMDGGREVTSITRGGGVWGTPTGKKPPSSVPNSGKSKPVPDGDNVDEIEEKPKEKFVDSGVESWAGRKETLEDRFAQDETVADLGLFYGLFDGHGGSACADHVSKRMSKVLSSVWPRYSAAKAKETGGTSGGLKEQSAVEKAFTEAFSSLDQEYLKISKKKDLEDGSTAVCALIVGKLGSKDKNKPNAKSKPAPRLYTANLGDSRAILCRGGEAIELTRDHKPNDREEKKRIEGCGGKVVQIGSVWRVTKKDVSNRPTVKVFLSTSRSLGDRPLKIPDPLVSGVPDIKMMRLQANDYFFVLVCDGVTDVMSDQDIVDIVCDNLDDAEVGIFTSGWYMYMLYIYIYICIYTYI
ncbi:hypothetical protein AAMO2058_001638600 [Amorphochlora amoebiformis]